MDSTTNRRRWYQYSIGGLLGLTLVIAVASYGFRARQERFRPEIEVAPNPPQLSDITVGLSAPGVISGGLDVPFIQDPQPE